jgi:hypothetical protein
LAALCDHAHAFLPLPQLRMSVPATSLFNIERLRRYDGPGWFLGAGFLIGLLFFASWLHARPDEGRHALRARGNGVVGMNAPDADAGGVLGDITGGELRAGAAHTTLREGDFFYSEPDADNGEEAGNRSPRSHPTRTSTSRWCRMPTRWRWARTSASRRRRKAR